MDFKNLYIAKTDRSDFVLEAAYEKAEEVLLNQTVPNPIPIMILGRLAIDQNYQGQGLGDALLRDALLRILQAADIAGIKAIIVHAISEQAKTFYLARSFIESPLNPMTMILPLESIQI